VTVADVADKIAEQLEGYIRIASQPEAAAVVDVYYDTDNRTFRFLVDGVILLGPISEAQMFVLGNVIYDLKGMEGNYRGI
jgi:hypothetical protein